MHRPLFLAGIGYLAICAAVVVRHHARRPPPAPAPAPAPSPAAPVGFDGPGDQAAAGIGAFVTAACAAARELAGLEQHLDAFDAQRDRFADPPAGWLDALARCERGRDALVQRLLEAAATLSRVSGDAALRAASPDAPLALLAQDLDAEGRLQAEAAQEVADLLRD